MDVGATLSQLFKCVPHITDDAIPAPAPTICGTFNHTTPYIFCLPSAVQSLKARIPPLLPENNKNKTKQKKEWMLRRS